MPPAASKRPILPQICVRLSPLSSVTRARVRQVLPGKRPCLGAAGASAMGQGDEVVPANKIMLIRHAEKPSDDNAVKGVSVDGALNPEELVVRGWQRSGDLVRYFAPLNGTFVDRRLVTPHVIFASSVGKHSNSLRPQHTVLELATVLNLTLVLSHPKGDEAALVADALAANGPVLIAWEHEAIPDIAARQSR